MLMKLAVLPDEAIKRNAAWVAPVLFAWRVLRPLWWFGLVECSEDGEDLGGGELAQERAVRPVPAILDGPRQDRGVAALTRTAVTRPPRRPSS